MTKTFIIPVEVQIEYDTPSLSDEQLRATSATAIQNALEFGETNGFEHPLADVSSIGIVAVD